MDGFLAGINPIALVWTIPVFFTIHELEEWNILAWYKKHYRDVPPSTPFSIHLHIIALSIASFVIIGLAYWLRSTFAFSLLVSALTFFILLNVFQHVVWTIQYRAYSPGLASGLLLFALTVFVNAVLIENTALWWQFYAVGLLAIPPAVTTLKSRSVMTPEVRRVHQFFIAFEKLLKGEKAA